VASYATVLVGTDGSETSFRAVERAASIAADAGAELVIVCAYRPLPDRERARAAEQLGDLAYKIEGGHPADDILTDAEGRARTLGATRIDRVSASGEPVDVIVDTARAKKADLVVVGNRGLNSLSGRLLGSVPQNVSHKSSCDVLIVHTTGR
jgi:nucleotide-binding universal stress UspA family protein